MKLCSSFLVAALLTSFSGHGFAAENDSSAPLLSGPEFIPINFRTARPRPGDTLPLSIEGAYSRRVLDRNLAISKNYSSARYEILGFTDGNECKAQACDDLSLRRATLIYEWMLEMGIPESSLSRPVGHGQKMPVGDNATEEGRELNRRVEIRIDSRGSKN